MNKRIERIKEHLDENKWAYISGSILLMGGVAAGYTVGHTAKVKASAAVNVNAYKSTVSVVNVAVAFTERSCKSKPIYCPELKRAFDSISDAARKLDMDRGAIQRNLADEYKKTNGLSFEFLVPEAS